MQFFISIPPGPIEAFGRPVENHARNIISIPPGPIEAQGNDLIFISFDEFQFHPVRLKRNNEQTCHHRYDISIPPGPIEAVVLGSQEDGISLFQFHLVRLKRAARRLGVWPRGHFNSTWSD